MASAVMLLVRASSWSLSKTINIRHVFSISQTSFVLAYVLVLLITFLRRMNWISFFTFKNYLAIGSIGCCQETSGRRCSSTGYQFWWRDARYSTLHFYCSKRQLYKFLNWTFVWIPNSLRIRQTISTSPDAFWKFLFAS